MQTLRWIFLAIAVLLPGVPGNPALAAPPGAFGGTFGASNLPVVPRPVLRSPAGRPEMHSYQPYSGLQFGFRPSPPVQRGVLSSQPRVIMPKRVAPLIEYGGSSAGAAQGYSYCAGRPGTVDPQPVGGAYGPRPVPERQCP